MAIQYLDLDGLKHYNEKLNAEFTAIDNKIVAEATTRKNADDALIAAFANYVTLATEQTISGIKTFSNYIKTPQVANSNGNALVRYKDTEVKSVFGNDSSAAVLMGNADRPYYSKIGSDFDGSQIALLSDIGQSTDLTNFEYYSDLSTAIIEPGLYIIQCFDTSGNLAPYKVYTTSSNVDNVYMTVVIVARNSVDASYKFTQLLIMQTMSASTTLADYFRTGQQPTSSSKFTATFSKTTTSHKFKLFRIEAGNLSTTGSSFSVEVWD